MEQPLEAMPQPLPVERTSQGRDASTMGAAPCPAWQASPARFAYYDDAPPGLGEDSS